jgi:hypothetical protein
MKRFKFALLFLGGSLLLFYFSIGIPYASYSPETSERYLWAAYHVHSTFSDGLGSLDEIARQARASRVNLVLLTDHGRPNFDTSVMDEMIDGVRFVGGSESGLPEGHMNFFGASRVPQFKLPPFPPDAIDDVREWGGFGVLTYPDDPKHQWEYWGDDFVPDGIEIINLTSYFRDAPFFGKLRTALLVPFTRYGFLKDVTSPSVALRRWDEALSRGPVLGFYACNAHGGFTLPLKDGWTVPMPSYSMVFSLVGLGIDKKYEKSSIDAVRSGDFFSILRGAGEPRVFEFYAQSDTHSYPSGSSLSGPAEIVVHVETKELQPTVVLKRDGETIQSLRKSELRFQVHDPGVYRAEIYLEEHPFLAPDVPWILSNPIFVDRSYEPLERAPLICEEEQGLSLTKLNVEKDEESTGSFELTESGAVFSFDLSRATTEKIDRWVALAVREKLDLSTFDGFFMTATSADYMRYQVEIRAGDKSYYSSLKFYPLAEDRILIPFSQFYEFFEGRQPIPLADIDSFFITLNTWSSQTGISSSITIRDMGFCRMR